MANMSIAMYIEGMYCIVLYSTKTAEGLILEGCNPQNKVASMVGDCRQVCEYCLTCIPSVMYTFHHLGQQY